MTYWKPEGYHQLGHGQYTAIATSDVLERFYEATGTKAMCELAQWLGVKMAYISDAKRRNIMPVAWLRLLVEKKSLYTPMWVLTGDGEKLWQE